MSEFKAAQDLIYAAGGTAKVEGVSVAVIPDGYRLTELERLLPAPKRVIGLAKLDDAESLVSYVNEFKGAGTAIFADMATTSVTAIIDFHSKDAPGWNDHKAVYVAKSSPEWAIFSAANKREMTQDAFASFIEENAACFAKPASAKLLEIAKSLQVTQDVKWRRSINLDSGDVQFLYDAETVTKAGVNRGAVELPRKVTLALAVFAQGRQYSIEARLRYRMVEGDLFLRFELIEPAKYVEDAFGDLVQWVIEHTDITPRLGSVAFGLGAYAAKKG